MINEVRMFLVEDNNLLRKGIVALLKKQGGINIEAATGRKDEVDQGLNLFKPHVILLNIALHSQNSLQVVKEVTRKYPDAKIVVMDLSPIKKEIIQYMDAGAAGFIYKDATPQEFAKTIKAVANGESVNPELFTDLLLTQVVDYAVVKGEFAPKDSVQITKFEMNLLELVNEGLSYKEIERKQDITPGSVKTHIHNIKQKLFLFPLI